MLIEKDGNVLIEAIAGDLEEEVHRRLSEAALAAGTTLAAALTLPKLAALLTSLFATIFAFAADKLFEIVQGLYRDDYSAPVSRAVQLSSAWKDGIIDLTVRLDKIWSPA